MNWSIPKDTIESFIKNVIFAENDFGVEQPKVVLVMKKFFLNVGSVFFGKNRIKC